MSNSVNKATPTSNDIESMHGQIPVTEREGEWTDYREFDLENFDSEALEYLTEEVLGEEVSIDEQLEANYGLDTKLQDYSELGL